MTDDLHRGVGLLIGNSDQSMFYVQIKDEQYPFPAWRGACAFWGGEIEKDDTSELSAVEREIEEEIPGAVHILKEIPKIKIDQYWVDNDTVIRPFELNLFEVLVSDDDLKQIAAGKVLEGYGELLTREELLARKWIWGMDFIFKIYLEMKEIG